MTVIAEYRNAQRQAEIARLRRVMALRAMVAAGMTQREIGDNLGVSQPAVNQQLKAAPELANLDPIIVMEAAAPILKTLAEERGFSKLAVFGSVARGQARLDSDIDLLVEAPRDASITHMVKLQELFSFVMNRSVDLVSYGGLKPGLDDDILREAVLL